MKAFLSGAVLLAWAVGAWAQATGGFRPITVGLTANISYANAGANLFGAKNNAAAGTQIIVGPGTFTTGVTNLWFPGTWNFQNSLLRLIDIPTNTTGSGIFDDRFSGAVTCNVMGAVNLEYNSGTNVWVDTNSCTFGYNTNSLGSIVVTNPATYINWTAQTTVGLCGQTPTPFALTVLHCRSNSLFKNFNRIYNLNPSNNLWITTTCTADPGTYYGITTGCAGLHWGDGDMSFTGGWIEPMTLQAVWGDNLTTNANQLWMQFYGTIDGKWYLVGRTNQWKIWAEAQEFLNSQGGSSLDEFIDAWNAGSHYFRAKKVSAKSVPIKMQVPDTTQTDTNLDVWVDFQKLSGSNAWLQVRHGWLHGTIDQFQQNGPNNGTHLIIVTNSGARVSLSGNNMEGANTIVHHAGGRTDLTDYMIRSTNRDPIFVSASGYHQNSVTLIPGLGATNAIRASSAQTVQMYGFNVAKSNVNANITLSTGFTNFVVNPTAD